MTKKMNLRDVERLFRGKEVREAETRVVFEVDDEEIGVTFSVPKTTVVLPDGSLFDPTFMPMVQYPTMRAVVPLPMETPVSLQCLCGRCEVTAERINFLPGVMSLAPSEINAVLLKAHWDARQAVIDTDWRDLMCASYNIVYSRDVTDDYRLIGDWYWIIQFNEFLTYPALFPLVVDYYACLEKSLAEADRLMSKFEDSKALCREMMEKILAAPAALGKWSISMRDDKAMVRLQGTTDVMTFRYDSVGLEKCAAQFGWVTLD